MTSISASIHHSPPPQAVISSSVLNIHVRGSTTTARPASSQLAIAFILLEIVHRYKQAADDQV